MRKKRCHIFGLTEADVVYEIMNSTANGRVTRLMAIVKDWGKITQFDSIRSTRPTNIMLAGEWNAVLCHDGGPGVHVDAYLKQKYNNNLSGGFTRVKMVNRQSLQSISVQVIWTKNLPAPTTVQNIMSIIKVHTIPLPIQK